MTFISVDPGVRGCGVAVFSGDLLRAFYVKNPIEKGDDYAAAANMASAVLNSVLHDAATTAIIECPMVYSGAKQRGAQSDIVAVAGVSYSIAARLSAIGVDCFRVLPYQWKGQVPKEIMLRRIESTLMPTELTVIQKTPKSVRHNVIDAIGIGLHYLGKL